MSEVIKRELTSIAQRLKESYRSTGDEAQLYYYNRVSNVLTILNQEITGPQDLQSVTDVGSVTTNAVEVGKLSIDDGTHRGEIGFGLINSPGSEYLDVVFDKEGGARFGSVDFDSSGFQVFGADHPDFPSQMFFDYGSTQKTVSGRAVFFRNVDGTPTNVMAFTSGSNVLIGTIVDDGYKFNVLGVSRFQGDSSTDGTIRFTSTKGENASHVHFGENGDWYIRSSDSDGKVVIQDTGGNVLIGTNVDSGYKLDVNGDSTADSFVTKGGTNKQYVMGDGSLSFGGGLYSQTQNSSTITHASGEASVVGSGVGSLSVPANYFAVGDTFKLSIHGDMSSANNSQLRIKLKEGALVIGQTTVTLSGTTNQHFNIDATFVVRSVGGPGVASLLTTGSFTYSKSSNNNPEAFYFDNLNNTNFNTTIVTTLDITAEWLTPEGGNQLFTQSLNLYKI